MFIVCVLDSLVYSVKLNDILVPVLLPAYLHCFTFVGMDNKWPFTDHSINCGYLSAIVPDHMLRSTLNTLVSSANFCKIMFIHYVYKRIALLYQNVL